MGVPEMKRAALIVTGTGGVFALAVSILIFVAAKYPDRPAGGARSLRIVVEKGMPLGEIAKRLHDGGVLDHPSWFKLYANERGMAQKIRAGVYTFTATMSPRQLLEKLVEGVPVEEVSVTIPEGKNLVEIAERLEQAGVCSKVEAERAARDGQLEGWLFPDTYRFRPGTPAQKVLDAMVRHGKEVLAELKAQHKAGVDKLQKQFKFGDREVVLMASLVEKETAAGSERPMIAGVFYNRLKLPTFVPHLLQTDPTIVYGCTVPAKKSAACKKFEGRIRRMHLEDKDNPYNTYTHEGLPPGPISNPGRAALEAALAPDETPYLFFVSKNDGTHQFSKTKAEHEAAVDKYQRKRGDSGS